jgi:hypothetical protein
MGCGIAERDPGNNDRFKIGLVERKFGMRRMVHALSLFLGDRKTPERRLAVWNFVNPGSMAACSLRI